MSKKQKEMDANAKRHMEQISKSAQRHAEEIGKPVPGLVEKGKPYVCLDTPEAVKLRALAVECQLQLKLFGERYVQLVSFAREVLSLPDGKALTPGQVRMELKSVGLADTRVSEILKVAQSSDANWQEYLGGKQSFKTALLNARGEEMQKPIEVAEIDPKTGKPKKQRGPSKATQFKTCLDNLNHRIADLCKLCKKADLLDAKNVMGESWQHEASFDGFTVLIVRQANAPTDTDTAATPPEEIGTTEGAE